MSVPSIPTGNKMLLLSAEEEEPNLEVGHNMYAAITAGNENSTSPP